MATDAQSALSAALDRLWTQFQPQMHERVALLQAAAQAFAEDNLSIEQHEAASAAAHKLAGVLGTSASLAARSLPASWRFFTQGRMAPIQNWPNSSRPRRLSCGSSSSPARKKKAGTGSCLLRLQFQVDGRILPGRSRSLGFRPFSAQARSKRSRFITLLQAATKSFTNTSCESLHA